MAYSIFDAPVDEIVAQLYLAYLGRAPDVEGFNYWRGQYAEVLEQANGDTAAAFGALAGRLQDAAEANGEFDPGEGTSEEIISYVYEQILGREPDAGGLAYWAEQYENQVPLHDIVAQLIDAARAQETTRDAKYLANRTEVAIAYVEAAPTYDPDGTKAATILNGVNETQASVDQALAELDRTTGENFRLTAGQDDIVGTAGDDVFTANVVQNILGQQVNSLGSGDFLDGGAGIDTLNAKITSGVFAGGSESMPIQPETKSIELINLQAVIADISGDGNNDQVFVNAKDMVGITEISSLYSDASLTIQNLTTKANESYNSGRSLTDLTIGMKYTGNSDSRWDESDFSVYFDQDFIVPQTSGKLSVALDLMNEDAYDYALQNPSLNVGPLDAVYVSKMAFTLNGQTFDLAPIIQQQTGENAESNGEVISNYAELLTAVRNAIVALKNQHPNNAELQTLEANLGGSFTSDISPVNGQLRVGTSIVLSVDNAAQDNTLVVRPSDLTINRVDEVTTIPNNNRYESAEVFTPEIDSTIAINVALEKVGLAGDGGQLVIGSMFKDSTNTWSDTYAGKGIQEFLTTVYGDAAKPSSLAGLHSTGNNLRVVKVASETRADQSYADLTIGNINTLNDGTNNAANRATAQALIEAGLEGSLAFNSAALKDVQDFDASNFNGDLTLYAALTQEITAKYLDLQDNGANPAADNINFTYLGGTGDDYINLVLDAANLAQPGTTTREDFTLNINGGAGDDEIVVSIQDATGLVNGNGANWYENSKINANLSITAGVGDDVVRTIGSGDWIIDLGAGDDTAYLDNTGDKAVWVFNALTGEIELDDLGSQPASSIVNAVNATVTVTFRDLSVTVAVANSVGALSNVAITDLSINQAIKAAINDDPVLSKLLVAEDGPARTLVVTSLIDGERVVSDLEVALGNTTLSASQQAAGLVQFDPAVVDTVTAAPLADRFDSVFAQDSAADLAGTDSAHVADNTVTGGLGDDILVLGTGANSNDIVVYSAVDSGFDTVVNFEVAGTGIDQFDFTTFLGGDAVGANLITSGALVSGNVAFADVTATVAGIAGVTFENVSAANLLAALNGTNGASSTFSLDATAATKNVILIADTADNVFKAFAVETAAGSATATSVQLIGTVDLADTDLSTLTIDNFV